MATTATANIPETELEEGQPGLGRPRRIGYIRDITYKVIPFCALFLIIFSAGGILLATLAHNEPIPHQGTVVISILLLVFLILFWVGSGYLYIKKRYPPLPKGPDAPDRPPPHNETFLTVLKRILNMLTAIHKRLHIRKEARAENNPAELESHQAPGSRPPRGSHQTNGQASDRSLRSHPVGPRENLHRHSYAPREPTIPERPGSPGSPDSIPHDMDARVSRRDSHIRVGVTTCLSQLLTVRRVEAIPRVIEMR
ncbi:Sorbose reductase sou1 [Hypoxylon texense]